MHPLGTSGSAIEGTHPGYEVKAGRRAQEQSWKALESIAARIKPGTTEKEAIELAYSVLKEMGSPRSWHRPIVRFAKNTRLSFREKQEPERQLQNEEMFLIDIGPNWTFEDFPGVEYEGDVGKTFVCGSPTPPQLQCIEVADQLFREASTRWRTQQTSGIALYEWMQARANDLGHDLLLEANGHRIGDFPHHNYFKKGLGSVEATPSAHLWVLEVHVLSRSGDFGAFYEDTLH
ncbi:MAG: aminopeptidase P family protein [Bdellovibrionales bacterium]|nr:aminopeptidase P family protein [Bdellovibrionales bacterium]